MNEPALLWPWPWWTAVLVAGAIIALSWVVAKATISVRNRRMRKLGDALREAGLARSDSFAVSGDKNTLVIDGPRMAMVDTWDGRIVQTLGLDDATGLKIYEVAANTIPFRLIGRNGSQSRKVTTRSIVEFARLFATMSVASKRIEYIQE
jgi:hypothetical protein